jgi:hypothetical protein
VTKTFIGTKMIKAVAMTRLAYNQYRGWDLPADEHGADEGYLVEYTDGGKPNHPAHIGYISWSPAEQFEAAYLSIGDVDHLAPHQQRVVAEKAQLDSKLSGLDAFFLSPRWADVDLAEKSRLLAQSDLMEDYSKVLAARIAAFPTVEATS